MPLQSEGELLAKIEMLLESRPARKKRIYVRLSTSVWGEGRKVIIGIKVERAIHSGRVVDSKKKLNVTLVHLQFVQTS